MAYIKNKIEKIYSLLYESFELESKYKITVNFFGICTLRGLACRGGLEYTDCITYKE